MYRRISLLSVVGGVTLFFASTVWADVPAPPVNQDIGKPDVAISSLTETDCRACHSSGVPDRHHLLFPTYTCLDCHDSNFTVTRNCLVCHTTSPHHETADAQSGDCVSCHGSLVNNANDGHYIPTYAPSLVTPLPSGGLGLPLNGRGNGAGACNYCHDDDGLGTPVILTNQDLHHGTGFGSDATKCAWCHDMSAPADEKIRQCESCHGPETLHNIQADSPNAANIGTIVVGGEDAGYGHVGNDGAGGDCWGCHGFAVPGGPEVPAQTAPTDPAQIALAPGSGPIIPTIYRSDRTVMNAGTDTVVVLSGSAFTNIARSTLFESQVALTAADGTTVILTPDSVNEGELTVTIPAGVSPGNYDLQAVKDGFASNPVILSIVPDTTIATAASTGELTAPAVTINGSGFGGHAEGSGTSVYGLIVNVRLRPWTVKFTIEKAEIVSWNDTQIEAAFRTRPDGVLALPYAVKVQSVFGSDIIWARW